MKPLRVSGDILPLGEFDRMRERQAFLEAVAQGLADVQTGRVISDDELRKQLDAEFGPLEAE